jgi:hypothetical protein
MGARCAGRYIKPMKNPKSAFRAARLPAALVLAAACASAYAADTALPTASSLLGPEAYAEALVSGRAVRLGKSSPALLPAHPAAIPMREAIAAEAPPILVEAAFLLPRRAPGDQAARDAELASIYGVMRSIGTLEGIEYYSASRKKMRTFYAESYLIDDPKTRNRLPDPAPPAPRAIPRGESLFAFQKDLSFGANVYRYDFESADGAVRVSATNLTRMSYALIPVMAPEALKTRLLVIQAEDAIVFYAASGAVAPGVFKGKLEDSFSNRAEALFKWFSASAKAFAGP